jgi:hypothetical protein
MSARDAFAVAVREDNIVVYEQYLALYGTEPLASGLRSMLDRRLMMLAWQEAVALNSAAGFAEFLARYPNSDLSATARKLQQRSQNRLAMASVLGGARDANLVRAVSTPGGTCPCAQPGSPNPNPGSVPPGTRASLPATPGGPVSTPGGPAVPGGPSGPGGPAFVPSGPAFVPSGPVAVPSGPVIVPIVPIIPPRITDPGRNRGTHDRGRDSGRHDNYPKPDGKKNSASSGDRSTKPSASTSRPGDSKAGSSSRSGREGRSGRGGRESARSIDRGPSRNVGSHRGDRGRIGRVSTQRAPARIAAPRNAPRFSAPRHAAPRFHAPRGGGMRMGGGGGFRMGGGGRGFKIR